MRSLSHLGRLALCGLICLLLLAVTITTTGLGDSRRADHAAILAGWSDQLGSNVTNVGVLDFTAALRIDSGWYMPPNPAWLIGAAQFDGDWSPAGWEVADTTPSDQGTLLIALNRGALTNHLWLGVSILAASEAELYVDLLGTNAQPVAVNLAGNLIGTGSGSTNVLITLPLADYPAATVIVLRRGKGELTVPLALLAMDEPSANPTTAGTIANKLPSERRLPAGGDSSANVTGYVAQSNVTASSTSQDRQGQPKASLRRAIVTWHVHAVGGSDNYSGRAVAWNGQHGPFATVNRALGAAQSGDTVIIAEGHYNESVDLSGRDVQVLINGKVDLSNHRK